MQEEVEKKSANLAIQTGKLTVKELIRLYKEYRSRQAQKQREKRIEEAVPTKGKQSVKELIGQGDGVKTVDIADAGLKDFQKTANKFGVDFAIVKDTEAKPPRYTVFFKAKDADAIDKVMSIYAAKQLKKEQKAEKPSILKKLAKFKDIVKNTPRKEHEKRKEQER